MMSPLHLGASRARAVEYMENQLRLGKTLASLLLRTVDFRRGSIASLIPAGYGSAELLEFEKGHLESTGIPQRVQLGSISGLALQKVNAKDDLTELIATALKRPGGYCLLENSLALSSDPWLQRAKSRIAIHETEVYHLLTSNDRDRIAIENAIGDASRSPNVCGCGACGRLAEALAVSSSGQVVLSTDDIKALASSAEYLVVSAYDGEGYLLWRN